MRYLDHIAEIDITHTAPHSQREIYNNLLYLRSVNEDKQAPPLPRRPGYQDAKKALVDMQKQYDKSFRENPCEPARWNGMSGRMTQIQMIPTN